jgi:hypothetical protein
VWTWSWELPVNLLCFFYIFLSPEYSTGVSVVLHLELGIGVCCFINLPPYFRRSSARQCSSCCAAESGMATLPRWRRHLCHFFCSPCRSYLLCRCYHFDFAPRFRASRLHLSCSTLNFL